MRNRAYFLGILARWAILTVSLAGLLFLAAGTVQERLIWAYLSVFSVLLLTTMLVINPELAEERVHPGVPTIDRGGRVATGFLFVVTLTTAALDSGRLHQSGPIPGRVRIVALFLFAVSTSVQAWAMAVNPFFSPVVRIQSERGHCPITHGPYRFVRHPGYLGMLVSMPVSSVALGSLLALLPALTFGVVIIHRAALEDRFLRANLQGYADYAQVVGYRLLPGIW
jgi:protein-S-isoprenylcysteine O-methyltransferase Ste14